MTIILIIGWFLCGLLGAFIACIYDMRRQEYNPHLLDDMEDVVCFMITTGPLALIAVLYMCLVDHFDVSLSKILYKIANIGIKDKQIKDKQKEEKDNGIK